jgi:hypothetical protein
MGRSFLRYVLTRIIVGVAIGAILLFLRVVVHWPQV